MRTKHNVTHTAINELVVYLSDVLKDAEYLEVPMACVISSLSSLKTQQQRGKYCETNFSYHAPKELEVGARRWVVRLEKSNLNRRIVPKTFEYISLKGTLSNLFSNVNFRKQYFNESPSTDGLIRKHRDSSNFQNHPLFIENSHALRIQIFNDGLETVNPLGSKTRKHQLEMFCFSILNLPTYLNSQLFHVHPFAVCRTKDVEEDNFVLFSENL